MTDSELTTIQKNATAACLSLSQFVRQRMMLQPITPVLPSEIYQLKADISGLCNNVNQIARAVNTKAREPTKAAEEAVLYARRAYNLVRQMQERFGHGV